MTYIRSIFLGVSSIMLIAGVENVSAQTIRYVDDDAPGDPGPGNPLISDPAEDGSAGHPFDAIQQAIDASIGGDEISVRPGTYTGSGNRDLDFNGKAITVRSENPGDPAVVAATIINCQGSAGAPHRAFRFHSGEDPNTILAGLTITGGYAPTEEAIPGWNRSSGGAILVSGASPTIRDCVIRDNTSGFWGGAVFCCCGSAPVLIRCTITDNAAVDVGGALYVNGSSPTLINCRLSGNTAVSGGGLYVIAATAQPALVNCRVDANTASAKGGGLAIRLHAEPVLTNCTLAHNSANEGGGVHTDIINGSPVVVNGILWGNTDSGGADQSAQVHIVTGAPRIDYTCVQGWTGSLGGTGNIGTDPAFVDADGPDDDPATWADNDLHLGLGSPSIDAGTNGAVPSDSYDLDTNGITDGPLPHDLAGAIRINPPRVDLGAYEAAYPRSSPIYVDRSAAGANNGSSWADAFVSLQDALYAAHASNFTGEIWVAKGTYYPDEGVNVTDDDPNRSFELVDAVGLYGGFSGAEVSLADRDISSNATMLSGDINLNDNHPCCEVQAAPGCPDAACESRVCGWFPECCSTGWTSFCAQWADDNCSVCWNGDTNSCHVVRTASPIEAAVLDGLTITQGNAPGPYEYTTCHLDGAGIYNTGNLTISNATIERNRAPLGDGGGVHSTSNQLIVRHTTVAWNRAHLGYGLGGGIVAVGNSVEISDCDFYGNFADTAGGAAISSTQATVTHCNFSGNTGNWAIGGLAAGTNLTLTDTTFIDNDAEAGAGALSVGGVAYVANCLFDSNFSNLTGGAAVSASGDLTIVGCSFVDNRAGLPAFMPPNGGGVVYFASTAPGALQVINSTFLRNSTDRADGSGGLLVIGAEGAMAPPVAIYNSIFWGNSAGYSSEPGQFNQLRLTGSAAISHCIVEDWDGSLGGSHCTDRDPRLDATGHARPGSPVIDAGSNQRLPADQVDINTNGNTTEPLPFDLHGNPRIVDDMGMPDTGTGSPPIVDIGAFEFQGTTGDIDGDGDVDLDDQVMFAHCLAGPDVTTPPGTCTTAQFDRADLTADDDLDLADFAVFSRTFGQP